MLAREYFLLREKDILSTLAPLVAPREIRPSIRLKASLTRLSMIEEMVAEVGAAA